MRNNQLEILFKSTCLQFKPENLILIGNAFEKYKVILNSCPVKVYYVSSYTLNEKLPNNWKFCNDFLWKEEADVELYKLSNGDISFIGLEVLKKMWRNIQIDSSQKILAKDFNDFLSENFLEKSSKFIWIDEFGAMDRILNIDFDISNIVVIAAKVAKIDDKEISEEQLTRFLSDKGFVKVAFVEDINPIEGVTFYVRDIKKELDLALEAIGAKQKELSFEKNKNIKLQDELLNLKKESCFLYNDIFKDVLPCGDMPYFITLNSKEKTKYIVSLCMKQGDILDAIDNIVLDSKISDSEKFDVCCEFARQIAQQGDKVQGVSFINNARLFISSENKYYKKQYENLISLAVELNQLDLAVDIEMEYNSKTAPFSIDVNEKLLSQYKKIREVSFKQQQHGHDLLIDYIDKTISDNQGVGKVLVEIGTTRENIPGQGSTLYLAKLCKRKGIKFITVDMDPHNTRWANFLSKKYNLDFVAITKKGEDFLANDIEIFDFVFLDAYDFDHGKHSELRQKQYENNLGSRINEIECHKMHLECVKSIVNKIKDDGVVCIDDTWKNDEGKWVAKGTSAVPFLLDNEFNILEARNNAIILNRRVNES